MAQLIRSAKCASAWTINELYAYNICVKAISPAEFFESNLDPSLDLIDPLILSTSATEFLNPTFPEETSEYLAYLDFATCATRNSSVVDFAAATLKLVGFSARLNFTVVKRYAVPLTICGEQRYSHPAVCVIHRPSRAILLVLVQDKTFFDTTAPFDVEAQIVADAIAAFQINNSKRYERGESTLESMHIPCIAMWGTTPTFYIVPVTQELCDAVITAQYPAHKTEVLKCGTFATHRTRTRDGMADIELRRIALGRFLAFKELAKSHWQQYIV